MLLQIIVNVARSMLPTDSDARVTKIVEGDAACICAITTRRSAGPAEIWWQMGQRCEI